MIKFNTTNGGYARAFSAGAIAPAVAARPWTGMPAFFVSQLPAQSVVVAGGVSGAATGNDGGMGLSGRTGGHLA